MVIFYICHGSVTCLASQMSNIFLGFFLVTFEFLWENQLSSLSYFPPPFVFFFSTPPHLTSKLLQSKYPWDTSTYRTQDIYDIVLIQSQDPVLMWWPISRTMPALFLFVCGWFLFLLFSFLMGRNRARKRYLASSFHSLFPTLAYCFVKPYTGHNFSGFSHQSCNKW